MMRNIAKSSKIIVFIGLLSFISVALHQGVETKLKKKRLMLTDGLLGTRLFI